MDSDNLADRAGNGGAGVLHYEASDTAEPHNGQWLGQGFWALMDQGLFAGSNFVLNVILARFLGQTDLGKTEFGAFTVAFTAFLLLGTIHNGLLVEPMLVFGPDNYRNRVTRYLGAMFVGNWLIALPAALVLLLIGIGAIATGSTQLGHAFIAAAFSAPLVLLLWLMRRACYVRFDPRQAAIGGLGYLLFVVSAIFWLQMTGRLSAVTGLLVMGIGSGLAGFWLVWREKVALPRGDRELVREVVANHWGYGRWAAPTGVVGFVPAYVSYLLLPTLISLEAAGEFRAMANFVMPLVTANAALCVLLLPRLVKVRGTPAFGRMMRWSMLLLAGGPLIAWLLLGIFNEELAHLAYAGRYPGASHLLWWIGLQPVMTGICGVYMAALEARQQPQRVFAASLVTAACTFALLFPLIWKWNIEGAAASVAITLGINAILLAFLFHRPERGCEASEMKIRVAGA